MNDLEKLKAWTVVVADTGDLTQVALHRPQEATTNPSLVLKAVQLPHSAELIKSVTARNAHSPMDELIDYLLVNLGCKILELIPGRVSTEVDARLSFDALATAQRARRIISMYKAEGVDSSRVLIKIAATWEGVQAARALELEGIHTNLTLLFNFAQAVACAQARVKLISPFVGRIYDWYKKSAGAAWDEIASSGANDPGVRSVSHIYRFFKQSGVKTEVMGASFRNTGQIKALAGCDLLTISPELLEQLSAPYAEDSRGTSNGVGNVGGRGDEFIRALSPPNLTTGLEKPVSLKGTDTFESIAGINSNPLDALKNGLSEPDFRFALNHDAMASEKLAEGIRAFCADTLKLEHFLQTQGHN